MWRPKLQDWVPHHQKIRLRWPGDLVFDDCEVVPIFEEEMG